MWLAEGKQGIKQNSFTSKRRLTSPKRQTGSLFDHICDYLTGVTVCLRTQRQRLFGAIQIGLGSWLMIILMHIVSPDSRRHPR